MQRGGEADWIDTGNLKLGKTELAISGKAI